MRALIVAFGVAIVGLSGCVTPAEQANNEETAQLNAGKPPEYAKGYADGWASGLAAGGNAMYRAAKDVDRYLSDAKYRLGWDDGYRRWRGRD
jgi:hypothetical protein